MTDYLFWFLVDTGATFTQIAERDLLRMEIKGPFPIKPNEKAFTAGYELPQPYLEKVRLRIGDTEKHDFESIRVILYQGKDPKEKERFLQNVPSLLGRDIIRLYKMTLTRDRVMFER